MANEDFLAILNQQGQQNWDAYKKANPETNFSAWETNTSAQEPSPSPAIPATPAPEIGTPVVVPTSTTKSASTVTPAAFSFSEVTHGKLQINDLLFHLPPEQISLSSHAQNLEYPLLRSKESVTLKSGHGDLYLNLPLKFVGVGSVPAWQEINSQLAPLVQQFRKTPFCLVENELVRKMVMPGTYDDAKGYRKSTATNIAFSLVNMTVSTVDGLPGCLQADLSMIYFNHRPFSNEFAYRKNWQIGSNITSSNTNQAAGNLSTWGKMSQKEFNPRNSEAWKAFWRQNWPTSRLLTTDLTNNFSLEFLFYSTDKTTSQVKVRKFKWSASKMIPAKIAVSFVNRVAKIPVLNWTYATHQFVGGMNRRVQVVFVLEDTNSKELESLQYLIQKDQEQTARYRYLNKTIGINIINDVTRVCGVNQVLIEDLNVDTVPGNPNLKRITLSLLEHYVPIEVMNYASVNRADSTSLQVLNRLLDMGKQQQVIKQNDDGSWSFTVDTISSTVNTIVKTGSLNSTNPQKQIYDLFNNPQGKYQMSLIDILNSRARADDTQTVAAAKEDQFWNQINETTSALLNGPLAKDRNFDDLRTKKFIENGNDLSRLCYKDLDLPKHPATGRVIDTDPDCYFYNDSDVKHIQNQKTFQAGINMVAESFKSFQNTTSSKRDTDSSMITDDPWAYPNNPETTSSVNNILPLPNSAATTQRQKQGMDYFTNQGWSPVQAAALVGNLTYESGGDLDPSVVQAGGGPGRGVAQWDSTRWGALETFADTNGLNPLDLQTQYAFVNYELTQGTEQTAGNALRQATDLSSANAIVINQYERPSSSSIANSTDKRLAQSSLAYNLSPTPVANTAPAMTASNLMMPVDGRFTSGVGDTAGRTHAHQGMDIVAPVGTPFYSMTSGVVSQNKQMTSGGIGIWIKSDDGSEARYYHLDSLSPLPVGTPVTQGQFLGYTGSTGITESSPHLHAEYRDANGQIVNLNQAFGITRGDQTVGPQGGTPMLASLTSSAKNSGQSIVSNASSNLGSPSSNREIVYDHKLYGDRGNKNQTTPIKVKAESLVTLSSVSPVTTSGDGPLNQGYFNPQLVGLTEIKAGDNPSQQTFDCEGAKQLFTQFANGYKDDSLAMRRAYPTFALYFIDEYFDNVWKVINDFYGWGAVKEIRLVRSRKNPVDTLIIELSNARGDLMTEQFNTMTQESKYDNFRFQKNVIKEGTSVQLKLGYHNDPEQLETCFNGVITEVQGQHSAIITLVCQSYAIEMFQEEKGLDPTKKIGFFNSDAREVISTLLLAPELKHFGRWQSRQGGQVVQPGEQGMQRGSLWRYFFNLFPMPADNNVFVPDLTLYQNIISILRRNWESIDWWGFSSENSSSSWYNFVPFRQTIWEIINEYTLRHPGYVASVVPYDGYGAHRATLFFGVPCQNHFYRAPNPAESAIIQSNVGYLGPALVDQYFGYQYQPWNQKIMAARTRPFRNYFYVDSEHHIVDNGIIATNRDTYNAVAVEYVKNSKTAFKTASDKDIPDPSSFFTSDVIKVKADDDIPEEYTRWFHTRERNCEGNFMAMRYGMGYLFKHLKDIYTGEIIILGEPKIKPYDTVFIFDSYNDIAGPIEVEQVTHIFSPENGFLSVITPDLVVNTNEYASASIVDAVGMWMKRTWMELWGKSVTKPFNSGQVNSQDISDLIHGKSDYMFTGPDGEVDSPLLQTAGAAEPITSLLTGRAAAGLGLVTAASAGLPLMLSTAIFGTAGIFYIAWAKQRQPIRVTPLLWKGRPFLCGLDGFHLDNCWTHVLGETGKAISGFKMLAQKAMKTMKDIF